MISSKAKLAESRWQRLPARNPPPVTVMACGAPATIELGVMWSICGVGVITSKGNALEMTLSGFTTRRYMVLGLELERSRSTLRWPESTNCASSVVVPWAEAERTVAPLWNRSPLSVMDSGEVRPWAPESGVSPVTRGATPTVGPHTLSTHLWPASHAAPHPPQLAGSVHTSMQRLSPSQDVQPPPQDPGSKGVELFLPQALASSAAEISTSISAPPGPCARRRRRASGTSARKSRAASGLAAPSPQPQPLVLVPPLGGL